MCDCHLRACYLCKNEATHEGWSGDPDDPKSKRILVCGLHSSEGDMRRAW